MVTLNMSSNGMWSEMSSGMISHEKRSAIAVSTSETSAVLIPAPLSHLAAHVGEPSFSQAFECASILS